MMRSLVSLGMLAAFVIFGFTVPLGKRTLFEHVGRIWKSEETQELVDDVKESSAPVVDRVTRGVKAGFDEATSDDDGAKDEAKADAGKEKEAPSKSDKPKKGAGEKGSMKERLRDRVRAEAESSAKKAATEVAKETIREEAKRLRQ